MAWPTLLLSSVVSLGVTHELKTIPAGPRALHRLGYHCQKASGPTEHISKMLRPGLNLIIITNKKHPYGVMCGEYRRQGPGQTHGDNSILTINGKLKIP